MAAPALVTVKTHSYDSSEFTNTTDFTVLHCTNVDGNNNKFYCIEIQENPTTKHHRLFTHYGRLGRNDTYELRSEDKLGDSLTHDRCKIEYDKIIKKKERGKTVKKAGESYKEAYVIVDVVSPSVGSTNIRNAAEVKVKGSNVNVGSYDDPDVSRVITQAVQENIHEITSNTSLKFTSRGMETPLGPVTESHLDKASEVLDGLRDSMVSKTITAADSDVRDFNSEYFSLIPREFGSKITDSDMIITADTLAAEYDLLNTLRTAVQAGLSSDSTDSSVHKMDIEKLSSTNTDAMAIMHEFESTKHAQHSQLHKYKVKNVFKFDIPGVTENFIKDGVPKGNFRSLFHGTRTANLLSIMHKGLIIPPTGAAHVTGRMFGNGVYGASCSTKALNYAVGYWSRHQDVGRNAFMLYVTFAMGNEYVANTQQYNGAPTGYDSIWGKAEGGSLLNDEYIVYDLNQVLITHIIELEY